MRPLGQGTRDGGEFLGLFFLPRVPPTEHWSRGEPDSAIRRVQTKHKGRSEGNPQAYFLDPENQEGSSPTRQEMFKQCLNCPPSGKRTEPRQHRPTAKPGLPLFPEDTLHPHTWVGQVEGQYWSLTSAKRPGPLQCQ